MLVLVLLSFIRTVIALRVPQLVESTNASDSTQPGPSTSTRSTSELVWSCITTIFACTWVAVHPNVPSIHASDRELFWRRVKILAVALIAPEFIILWAANQLRSAFYALRTLREFHACRHWTMTHGMFLVMGGFMLINASGKHLEVLQEKQLAQLLRKGDVTLRHIPETEVMDRSKGDALAKTLVLIQTSWFIAQVISRAVLHLPITELELTTVAFALLNFLTYALWWKKPLDVRYPILVALLHSRELDYRGLELEIVFHIRTVDEDENTVEGDVIAGSEDPTSSVSGLSLELSLFQEFRRNLYSPLTDDACNECHFQGGTEGQSSMVENGPSRLNEHGSSPVQASDDHNADVVGSASLDSTSTILFPASKMQSSTVTPKSIQTTWESLSSKANSESFIVSLWPSFLGLFRGFISPLSNMSLTEDQKYTQNVPIFYAGALRLGPAALQHSLSLLWFYPMALEMLIGALFGSIHCAAWAFQFPSKLEQELWRTMSLCITVVPLAMIIGMIPSFTHRYLTWNINCLLFTIYILARLTILVMAFVLLRDLPEGAFEEVEWTTFIPHV